jgi:hypothetical protein
MGWTAQMIVRYPTHAALLGIAFYAYPWVTFQLIRLIAVESVRTSGRLGYGTAKIFAPKTTEKVRVTTQNVRRYFASPIPEWMKTGSGIAKGGAVTAIVGTGIGMIAEANAKANRGDIGGETTLGDYLMEAEFDQSDRGRAPELRMHGIGGPGGIIV